MTQKRYAALLILLVIRSLCASWHSRRAVGDIVTEEQDIVRSNGRTVSFRLYQPSAMIYGEPLPAVLTIHGISGLRAIDEIGGAVYFHASLNVFSTLAGKHVALLADERKSPSWESIRDSLPRGDGIDRICTEWRHFVHLCQCLNVKSWHLVNYSEYLDLVNRNRNCMAKERVI